jgi:hypothetical protein
VAFKIPDPRQTSSKEFQVISNLMKDVGSALESMAGALPDGVVNENELNATIPKLEVVIRDCASVKYLLETHFKNRKKRAKQWHSRVPRSSAGFGRGQVPERLTTVRFSHRCHIYWPRFVTVSCQGLPQERLVVLGAPTESSFEREPRTLSIAASL